MKYWNNNGKYQFMYDEMLKNNWGFNKTNQKIMRRYYRYYNDGDVPYRYRGINMLTPHKIIEATLEDDANQMILREFKRFTNNM